MGEQDALDRLAAIRELVLHEIRNHRVESLASGEDNLLLT